VSATLTLWSHALAALMFGALVPRVWQMPERPRALAMALALTALAALAVAGIDANDPGARASEAARDLAWIGVLFLAVRSGAALPGALVALYATVAGVIVIAGFTSIAEAVPEMRRALPGLTGLWPVLRMVAAAGGLVLVHHAAGAADRIGRPRLRLVAVAIALMWSIDLVTFALARWDGGMDDRLIAARGVSLVVSGVLIAAAATARRDAAPSVSRALATRGLGIAAILLYAGAIVAATGLAALAGAHARLAQTIVVLAAGAALFGFLSTPDLAAWVKVKLAKHLFAHRYDYRTEWQRFTATLATAGEGAEDLHARIVRAMAAFTDSPAGLLLIADAERLQVEARWNWTASYDDPPASLVARLATGHIASAEDGLSLESWAIVPLIHADTLVAAVVLAAPPVARALDWEDFDLFRAAGRQAASYLAEDRAHAALAEAQRFDEFHRRFAFIMHDLKNLVSQMTLTASNARRHADNPAFRADMVATLGDCAERMSSLLARLSTHADQPPAPIAATDVAAIARRVARAATHPVAVDADAAPLALAQAPRLEQVIGHLIQNAVEASTPDAPVAVRVRADGGAVTIEVVDQGHGMTPGFVRDALFRPFASSKPGGFGLGAFEARQLVHAMGGTLDVDSREGEGTCFRISLTVAPPVEIAA
jgi:signal transduction histidine kinase